jgi:hypothetical protein
LKHNREFLMAVIANDDGERRAPRDAGHFWFDFKANLESLDLFKPREELAGTAYPSLGSNGS